MLEWANPLVQAALLQAAGTIIAATAAALAAGFLGKRYADRKRLEEKLATAIGDIEFLLEVERAYGDLSREQSGQSNHLRVRRQVRDSGYAWSGSFTPGRVRPQMRRPRLRRVA